MKIELSSKAIMTELNWTKDALQMILLISSGSLTKANWKLVVIRDSKFFKWSLDRSQNVIERESKWHTVVSDQIQQTAERNKEVGGKAWVPPYHSVRVRVDLVFGNEDRKRNSSFPSPSQLVSNLRRPIKHIRLGPETIPQPYLHILQLRNCRSEVSVFTYSSRLE